MDDMDKDDNDKSGATPGGFARFTSSDMGDDNTGVSQAMARPRQVVADFLRKHTTYDMIPDSAKVVVLDTDLPIKNAFYALVEHDMTCAVLWDSRIQDYVGMLTVTDFIDILRYFYKHSNQSIGDDLEETQIRRWRELSHADRPSTLISIDPEDTVFDACRKLKHFRIHRLPILEKQTHNVVLHIITHSRVLGFLVRNLRGFPEILDRTIQELRIGSFDHLYTVRWDTPLIQALTLLSEKKISAVPVVDDNGVVIDIYSRSDVTNLARDRSYNNLDMTVQQALLHHHKGINALQICKKMDTLKIVFERLAIANVHRLVCVDPTGRPEGIVSTSDIFSFFVG